MNNNKITFADKVSNLKINSKYVISADNINEIKNVVNDVSDAYYLKLRKNKFLIIDIPLSLKSNILYDIEFKFFKFDENEDFSISEILKLSNQDDFISRLKFTQYEYIDFSKYLIDKNDFGQFLILEINDQILKKFDFCRYRFIKSGFNLVEIGTYYEDFSVNLEFSDLYDGESTSFTVNLGDLDITNDEKLNIEISRSNF